MKKCTCMGAESFVCRCLWEATLKELADWGYRAEKAEKELAEAKAKLNALAQELNNELEFDSHTMYAVEKVEFDELLKEGDDIIIDEYMKNVRPYYESKKRKIKKE